MPKPLENLKPCPFCGGNAYIHIVMSHPYIRAYHTKSCRVKPDTYLFNSSDIRKHIEAWNRRAKDADKGT